MDTTDTPRPRRRFGGCVLTGCLALLALVAVPPVLVIAWAARPGPQPDWQDTSTVHAVPAAPVSPIRDVLAQDVAASQEAAASSLEGDALPAGEVASARSQAELPAGRPGRIELDVSLAELDVVPVAAGSPVRLEARYDRARYRLDEGLEETADGWVYRLHFRSRGAQRFWTSGTQRPGRLRLEVPRGTPLAIDGAVGMGASTLELGGLSLSAVDLELGAGEHAVSFSEPTAAPMRLLRLQSGMGELTVAEAGNASPRDVEIEHGMGEVELDLRGAWKADSTVDIEMGMGDCRVFLPEPHQAGGMVVDSEIGMGSRRIDDVAEADLPPGLPRVRIHASGGMGNIDVR